MKTVVWQFGRTNLGALLALMALVAVPYPASLANTDEDPFAYYCEPDYELYDATVTLCDPGMYRDLYHQGIHELDINEQWACRVPGSQKRDSASCPGWSRTAPGSLIITRDQISYHTLDGTEHGLGSNSEALDPGLFICCYTRALGETEEPSFKGIFRPNPNQAPPSAHGNPDNGRIPVIYTIPR